MKDNENTESPEHTKEDTKEDLEILTDKMMEFINSLSDKYSSHSICICLMSGATGIAATHCGRKGSVEMVKEHLAKIENKGATDVIEESKEIESKLIALLDSFEGKYPHSVIAMTFFSVAMHLADMWVEGTGIELLKNSIKAINERKNK